MKNTPVVTAEQMEKAIAKKRANSGKPSLYNEDMAADILVRVENGENIVTIAKDKDMPCFSVIYDWMRRMPDFAKRYEEAKKVWTHAVNMQALQQLSDTPDDAQMALVKKNEAIAKHTLELTSRMNPADYAPKQQIQMDVRSVQIRTTHEGLAKLLRE